MRRNEYGYQHHEEEDLRCPICSYYFSENRKPFLISCNHNLCKECIDEISRKNLWFCPICKHNFNRHDAKNFKVNIAFKNIVVKILETKMIYCSECRGIFGFNEHAQKCDEINFKDVDEVYDQIKELADSCVKILRSNKNKDIVELAKTRIEGQIGCIWSEINNDFNKSYKNALESFLKEFPIRELSNCFKGINRFVRSYAPVSNLLGKNISDDTFISRRETLYLSDSEDKLDTLEEQDEEVEENTIKAIRRKEIKLKKSMVRHDSATNLTPKGKKVVQLDRNARTEMKRKYSVRNQLSSELIESPQMLLDDLLKNYNDTQFKLRKFEQYSEQINFFIESLKTQIFDNYSSVENSLRNNITGIFDNLRGNFKNTYNRYICYLIASTKRFSIFCLANSEVNSYELTEMKDDFVKYASVANFDEFNTVYVSGGVGRTVQLLKIKETISDNLFLFSIKEKKIKKRVKLPRARAFHAGLLVKKKLYLIGGCKQEHSLVREVECFNSETISWEYTPKIEYPRLYPSVCLFNQRSIFLFSGQAEGPVLPIEVLNLDDNRSWRSITPNDPGRCWTSPQLAGVTVLNEKEILICGGVAGATPQFASFIYNPKEKTVYRSIDLKTTATFNNSTALFNRKIVMLDQSKKNTMFHEYDIETETWKIL